MCRSEVGAGNVPKDEQPERQSINVHIGVFFEGSGLNMVREYIKSEKIKEYIVDKDKHFLQDANARIITPKMLCEIENEKGREVGFTNVSMLYTLFTGTDKLKGDNLLRRIYIEGAGTSDISVETKIWREIEIEGYRWSEPDGIFGFGLGQGDTGVVALVSKAVKKVTETVESEMKKNRLDIDGINLHFYVFGFSRGAACSRLFCHLLTRDVESTLKCEKEFSKYGAKTMVIVKKKGLLHKEKRLEFLEEYKSKNKVTIEFVGLYDTVASVGFLKRKDGSTTIGTLGMAGGFLAGDLGGALAGGVAAEVLPEWHYNNVDEYGLYTSSKISHICHLCAMDEFRENFALVNLGKSVPNNAVEIMIPGCHSDVGGSYLNESDKEGDKPVKPVKIKKHKLLCINRDKAVYKMCIKPSNENPDNPDNAECDIVVGRSSLEKLGWINDSNAKLTQDDDDWVEMTRSIQRGYSDIPLAMMMIYFFCKVENIDVKGIMEEGVGNSKFFVKMPYEHYYGKLEGLKEIGDKMVAAIVSDKIEKGQRYWIVPSRNPDSDSDPYPLLRSKYLHFSAKEEGKDAFINAPNYNENYVMCRITYHGDAGEQKSAAEGVHFLYELSGTPMNIEFGEDSSAIRYLCQKELSNRFMSKTPKVRI